jgi:hypothetical protein
MKTARAVIAAACLTLASTAAFAQVTPPPTNTIGPTQPSNNGGLYLTVWNPTTQVSLVAYLGLNIDDALETLMAPDGGRTINFGVISGFTELFGDGANTLWHISAVDSQGAAEGRRVVTTSMVLPDALGNTFGIDSASVLGISNSGRDFFNSLSAACGATSSGGIQNPCRSTTSGFYAGTQLWGEFLGGGLPVSAAGLVGTALQFFFLQGTSDIGEIVQANIYGNAAGFGQWLLDATGQLTYTMAAVTAIPLPAAVWLLLSGLVGLTAIGRRRLAAA